MISANYYMQRVLLIFRNIVNRNIWIEKIEQVVAEGLGGKVGRIKNIILLDKFCLWDDEK